LVYRSAIDFTSTAGQETPYRADVCARYVYGPGVLLRQIRGFLTRVCDLSLVLRGGADLLPDPEEVAAHHLAGFSVAIAVREQRLRNRLEVRVLPES
jgi:hypothetical protein